MTPNNEYHAYAPEHKAAQNLIAMFDRVPVPFCNEAHIAKEKLVLLARKLREIQGERMEFPDTTDIQIDSPWYKRKTQALTETRELLSTIQNEYKTSLPFDPGLVDDEHLTSTLCSLADMAEDEDAQAAK